MSMSRNAKKDFNRIKFANAFVEARHAISASTRLWGRLMLDGHSKKALALLSEVHQHARLSSRCPASNFPHFSCCEQEDGEEGASRAESTLIIVECFKRAKELEEREKIISTQFIGVLESGTPNFMRHLPAALLKIHNLLDQLTELNEGEEREEAKAKKMRSVFHELMVGGGASQAMLDDDAQDVELVNGVQCEASIAAMEIMFQFVCTDSDLQGKKTKEQCSLAQQIASEVMSSTFQVAPCLGFHAARNFYFFAQRLIDCALDNLWKNVCRFRSSDPGFARECNYMAQGLSHAGQSWCERLKRQCTCLACRHNQVYNKKINVLLEEMETHFKERHSVAAQNMAKLYSDQLSKKRLGQRAKEEKRLQLKAKVLDNIEKKILALSIKEQGEGEEEQAMTNAPRRQQSKVSACTRMKLGQRAKEIVM